MDKMRLLNLSSIVLAASAQGLAEWLALARSRWADQWRGRFMRR